MSTLVQVKDVPDDIHRTLKARAAESGQSLSEFLRIELSKIATRPPQLRRRIEARETLTDLESSAEVVRSMRDEE